MKKVAVGIDIGGTNTKFGFVDSEGKVLLESSISTTDDPTFDGFLSLLKAAIDAAQASLPEPVSVIGWGMGAPNANYFHGTIEMAPNLSWKGVVPVAKTIQDRYGIRAVLTNDANAAAIGEQLFGGGKQYKDFVVITLGTGLGSGIVVGSELVYGHDGFAGELGHTTVVRNGRVCGCGRRGCLETYVSATGIKRTAFELMAEMNEPSPLRDYTFNTLSAAKIHEAALLGDALALEAFRRTGQILGEALTNTMAHNSPEAFFIFGGLAKAGDFIMRPTREAFEKHVLPIYRNKVKIELSRLDEGSAAVVGAAALAWKEFQANL